MLRREVGRLNVENSRLHADLLQEADARAAADSAAYQHSKQLEAQAAEAACARGAALKAAAAMERERDGLRKKVRDLLSVGQQGACKGGELQQAAW